MTEREMIRKSLEKVCQEFHQLLGSIPIEYWKQTIPGEDWTIQMEVAHIVQAVMLIPGGVERVRKGKRGFSLLFLVPLSLRNWVNGHVIVPSIAHKFTPAFAAWQYDQAHQAVLACLETICEDDLQRSATFGYGLNRTIEEIFLRPVQHFSERHAAIQQMYTSCLTYLLVEIDIWRLV